MGIIQIPREQTAENLEPIKRNFCRTNGVSRDSFESIHGSSALEELRGEKSTRVHAHWALDTTTPPLKTRTGAQEECPEAPKHDPAAARPWSRRSLLRSFNMGRHRVCLLQAFERSHASVQGFVDAFRLQSQSGRSRVSGQLAIPLQRGGD